MIRIKTLVCTLLLPVLFCFGSIHRGNVLADFDLGDIPVDWAAQEETGIGSVSFANFRNYISKADPSSKVLFMNPPCALQYLDDLKNLTEKPILFLWEPVGMDPSYYPYFSKIYTYNDAMVDGKKFFKFYYPHRQKMVEDLPSFESKNLCVMVARHWVSERCKVVRFFQRKSGTDFAFYGSDPGDFGSSPLYKGRIPGHHSGDDKIQVLKNYRFCVCFENTYHIPGYITEKIFACFAAGCVPIYYGAPNVTSYIPENCFIDYRKFKNLKQLYAFIKNMPEHEYQAYLRNIRSYLESPQSYVYSPEHFVEILNEAVNQ